MLLMLSRGFKDIITETARLKEFPGVENKLKKFEEIKVPFYPYSGTENSVA